MPELPDVAGFQQILDDTAVGRRIDGASVRDARIVEGVEPETFTKRVKGRRIESSRRHGKFLFAALDRGDAIAMHFGMTGELAGYGRDAEDPRYMRLVLDLDDGRRLAYICRRMLGRITLTDDVARFIGDHNLGPDALDEGLDAATFRQRLGAGQSALKPKLMDQQVVAGIGNVWADEVLFQARHHPKTRIADLTEKDLDRLFQIMRRVLQTGARHGGDADKLPEGYLLPHRHDKQCPGCGGPIEKITVSGRSAHYCPRCQSA